MLFSLKYHFLEFFGSSSIRSRRPIISSLIAFNFSDITAFGSGLPISKIESKKDAKKPAIAWAPGTNYPIAPIPALISAFAINIDASSAPFVIIKEINRNSNIILIFLYIIFFFKDN